MKSPRIPNPSLLPIACGLAVGFITATAQADVRLPKIFSDHMVLQRDKPAQVWGWADPGEKVGVKFAGQNLTGTADKDGAWNVKLTPMKANPVPQELVVGGKNTVRLTDILIGDVWMVSGQSNAAFGLGGCNAPEDVSGANFPLIRYSGYFEHFAGTPQRDGGAPWQVVTPGSAAGCSAIGFYFARKVQPAAGVPIGILTCAVGGTEIENWMSPEAIHNYPDNASVSKAYRDTMTQWEAELAMTRNAPAGERPAFLPVSQPIGIDVAVAWVAKVREALKTAATPIDPSFVELETWIKTARAALTARKPVPAPPEFVYAGTWLLTTPLPADLKRIPLAPYPMPDRWGIGGHGWFRTQSLYNGMIHPLIPFSIKGMLWYQGEGGSGKAYCARVRSMVETMRKEKNDEFPVYIVQLPNFDKSSNNPQGDDQPDKWPTTREQQLKCLQIPKVGVAVTIDVGDPADLHPKNKGDMGERLALWALARDYGKPIVYSGPLYKGIQTANGKIKITFDSTGGGLMAGKKDGRNPAVEDKGAKLKQFAVAGEDRKWAWADAVIDGKSVVVSSREVPKPVAVRYAFSMNPEGCNLYNKEGLPASPFRSDDW